MKPIPTIIPIYAALLALFFVYLSLRIIRQRHSLKIGLGDAGNKDIMRAMRVLRTVGMALTFTALIASALHLLWVTIK